MTKKNEATLTSQEQQRYHRLAEELLLELAPWAWPASTTYPPLVGMLPRLAP